MASCIQTWPWFIYKKGFHLALINTIHISGKRNYGNEEQKQKNSSKQGKPTQSDNKQEKNGNRITHNFRQISTTLAEPKIKVHRRSAGSRSNPSPIQPKHSTRRHELLHHHQAIASEKSPLQVHWTKKARQSRQRKKRVGGIKASVPRLGNEGEMKHPRNVEWIY